MDEASNCKTLVNAIVLIVTRLGESQKEANQLEFEIDMTFFFERADRESRNSLDTAPDLYTTPQSGKASRESMKASNYNHFLVKR